MATMSSATSQDRDNQLATFQVRTLGVILAYSILYFIINFCHI